ncbi:MAG: regulatory iron-sulfur-containing complex subunit RicT [Ardenticatenaceae bacterium]|nr:regulatory iron-sulfur-containing complex subunit RicT [Ardenticatenaceae bacterium]
MTTVISTVIGVRFQKLGKMYHFSVGHHENVAPGDHVIVKTRRGVQLGQVITFIKPEDVFRPKSMRTIERKATPRDLVLQQVWNDKELNALITVREQAHKLRLRDIKFVKAEYNFDGSSLTILYATENKGINLGALVSNVGRILRTDVDAQLIGPRDVAKIIGGYGACGGPRCCSTFITEFSPVSIKMAKAQGISLSPSEITGVCGRLRCCLVYEYEQYVEAKKQLPKKGKRIGTPHGEGVVVDVRVLRESVVVRLDEDNKRVEVFKAEFEPLEELKALEEKAKGGCSKHEGGGCDCGAK